MKQSATALPLARKERLLLTDLSDELLVYDLKRHKAYCLNSTAAAVWKKCNGKRTVSEIARSVERELGVQIQDQVVWLAIARLKRARLLDDSLDLSRKAKGFTRREMIRKAGLAAACALPLVTSIVAPTAANAQTVSGLITPQVCNARRARTTGCGGTPCTTGGNCLQLAASVNCRCQ